MIIGAGSYAKVIIDIIEKQKTFRIDGLLDDNFQPNANILGYRILGAIANIPTHIHGGIVAVGDNWARNQIVKKIKQSNKDFIFISAIHPSAIIGRGVKIGCGSALLAGSIINSGSRLGDHSIISNNVSVDHDNILGNFSSLAPGAITCGNVSIAQYTHLGAGAKVIQGRSIGDHCVIGAGAVVTKNVDAYSVQYGVPAKFIRSRVVGEKYL